MKEPDVPPASRTAPRIAVSGCLGFAPVRYDGVLAGPLPALAWPSQPVFLPFCPETAIGLGVPRARILLAAGGGVPAVYRETDGYDVGGLLRDFAHRWLQAVQPLDGVILKSKSPSCGIGDVKVYDFPGGKLAGTDGTGVFAQALRESDPGLPLVTDAVLSHAGVAGKFLAAVSDRFRGRQ